MSYEGTGTNSVSPDTGDPSWLHQGLLSFGVQAYLRPRLYVRGGVGLEQHHRGADTLEKSSGGGMGATAGVGFEILQAWHTALGVEAAGALTHYRRETWKTGGAYITLAFY